MGRMSEYICFCEFGCLLENSFSTGSEQLMLLLACRKVLFHKQLVLLFLAPYFILFIFFDAYGSERVTSRTENQL